jgi:hypothetical protein
MNSWPFGSGLRMGRTRNSPPVQGKRSARGAGRVWPSAPEKSILPRGRKVNAFRRGEEKIITNGTNEEEQRGVHPIAAFGRNQDRNVQYPMFNVQVKSPDASRSLFFASSRLCVSPALPACPLTLDIQDWTFDIHVWNFFAEKKIPGVCSAGTPRGHGGSPRRGNEGAEEGGTRRGGRGGRREEGEDNGFGPAGPRCLPHALVLAPRSEERA